MCSLIYQIVHFKYVQFIICHYTLIKLLKEKKIKSMPIMSNTCPWNQRPYSENLISTVPHKKVTWVKLVNLDYLEVRSVWQVVESCKLEDLIPHQKKRSLRCYLLIHQKKKIVYMCVCEICVVLGFMLGYRDTELNQI